MAMQGYLESLYLTDGYLSGHIQDYLGVQIDKKIEAHIFDLGSQIDLEIQDSNSVSVQIESKIYFEYDIGTQIQLHIENELFDNGSQVDLEIQDSNIVSVQVESKIDYEDNFGTQILNLINDYEESIYSQIDNKIRSELINGVQSELSILDENRIGIQTEKIARGYNVNLTQIEMLIEDNLYSLKNQIDLKIKDSISIGSQVELKIIHEHFIGLQIERLIEDLIFNLSTQIDLKIYDLFSIGSQIELKNMYLNTVGSQIERFIEDLEFNFGVEVVKGGLLHIPCPRYLMVPYLTDKYLAECFTTPMGTQIVLGVKERIYNNVQVNKKINFKRDVGVQVELRTHNVNDTSTQIDLKKYTDIPVSSQVDKEIRDANVCGVQIKSKIYFKKEMGSQANLKIIASYDDLYLPVQVELNVNVFALGFVQTLKRIYIQNYIGVQILKIGEVSHKTQVNKVLYNTTQLRILIDFASRGVPAQNGETWTNDVPDGIAEGDYDPNNLNTDILEQITKTAPGVRGFSIWCDTGKPNTYVDTIAILNHNFTKGAVVEIYGYTTNPNGAADITIRPTVELENTYWISPDIPSNPYRYWRIFVLDYGNPYSIYMGVVVIGSSKIVSLAECFDNPVTFGFKHFKDTIETEGFSPVSNDRAIRKNLSLSFSMIKYNGGNYKMLRDYFITNKTDLKALVIPRPTNPSSLAVFSKLSVLPSESHTAITDEEHYVSLTLDYDESL